MFCIFSKCENPTTITLFTHSWWNWDLELFVLRRGKTGVCEEKPVRARHGLPDAYPVHLGGRLFLTPLHNPCYVQWTKHYIKVHFSTCTDSSPSLLVHLKLCTFIALWMSQNLSFAPFLDDLNPKMAHFEGICHEVMLHCFAY